MSEMNEPVEPVEPVDTAEAGEAAAASKPRWRRIVGRVALALVAATALLAIVLLVLAWVPMGEAPDGARLERMEASPQWSDGSFANPDGMWVSYGTMVREIFDASEYASPDAPIPYEAVPGSRFASAPASGLRATWLGHSTILIEIDGARILTDPVWGPRPSPYTWLGPERWYPPPLALDELPALDAVLISHDHYDHLDYPTIVALAERVPLFITPLGVGAHLEYWGVAPERILELDWWEQTMLPGGLRVAATPARHASGRSPWDRDRTLWAGYALLGPDHRVYFSGDTGMFRALPEIGETFGPFDLTMIETGAYGQAWPDWHIGPEQAVEAHRQVGGEVFLPIHWGLFNLAYHGWTEPIERSVAAAEAAGVTIATPRPGQSIEPSALEGLTRWWPELPYQRAADYPIVSTQLD